MVKVKKEMKNKKFKQERAGWFTALKNLLKVWYRKPQFIFLGEKPQKNAIILSNHEGSYGPLQMEIWAQFPLRMWGTYEMNSSFKELYRYQSQIYFHQKKHWNIHLARLFCVIAAPLTYIFYRGLRLISTYRDMRFLQTVKQSYKAIAGGENVVIFPEDSSRGYFKELTEFYAGFTVFANYCLKKGVDAPVYVSYYKKKERAFIFSEPILFSKLKSLFKTREDIAEYMLQKCNSLNKLDLNELNYAE